MYHFITLKFNLFLAAKKAKKDKNYLKTSARLVEHPQCVYSINWLRNTSNEVESMWEELTNNIGE